MSMSTKKTHKRDNAVSPVVGVMLMLVVTILIASLVAALASDVAGDVEKSATAVLDIKVESHTIEDGGGMGAFESPKFSIIYLSGDTKLDTSKMKIVSSWIDSDGDSHTYTASGYLSCYMNAGYTASALYVRSQETLAWQEYPDIAFGNVVLTSGNKLTTPVDTDMWNWEDSRVTIENYPPFEQIFGPDYYTIDKGTQISIAIIYGKHTIYDKVVTVE